MEQTVNDATKRLTAAGQKEARECQFSPKLRHSRATPTPERSREAMLQESGVSKPLLTPDEFWKALQGTLGRGTIYDYCKSGKIKRIKVGKRYLIPRSELEEFPRREAEAA